MKKNEVIVGNTYIAKVSGKLVPIKIMTEDVNGGWSAVNLDTRRDIRIRSGRRLRKCLTTSTD